MANYIYITPEQAKITHEKTIEYSGGGTLEELDFGRLESVLYNIQNDDWYPHICFSAHVNSIVLLMGTNA